MALRRLVVLIVVLCSALAFAQVPNMPGARWAVLVDPVCPVANFYSPPLPNATKEMRVMYFPAAKDAKLKDPQSLTLKIAFNHPEFHESATIPFARKDDHWEAVVPLEKPHAMYAIFSVADEKANAIDDNSGQFWDLVLCSATGEKDVNGTLRQAQSYTGISWPLGIRRAKDYNKAISILETALAADPRRTFALNDLWNYKVQRDGGDAQAWAKLAKEIGQFLNEHPNDRNVPYSVGDFVVRHQDKLPADFVEETISRLEERLKDTKHSLRARAEYNRCFLVPDPRMRLAAFDTFIAKYPNTVQVSFAELNRFQIFVELGDVAAAESAFAKYQETKKSPYSTDPNDHYNYLDLASLYIDKNVKLDEALKLIQQAQDSLKNSHAFEGRKVPEPIQKSVDAQSGLLRAKIYIAQHKPDMALAEAQKALKLQDNAGTHFVLAQALAATGDKNKALDEYFEAALRPSNKDADYGAELKQYYLRQHFGNSRRFDAELQKRKATRFQQSHYVPTLVDRDAPEFSFVTTKGEKFEAAVLDKKTVIVNFWSPG